jgi:uncharacterized protein (DUF433 family)
MRKKFVGRYLVVDPKVCHGRLTFTGTRVPVETVLHWLAKGNTLASILAAWPEIPPEAIEEATKLAAASLAERHEAGVASGR